MFLELRSMAMSTSTPFFLLNIGGRRTGSQQKIDRTDHKLDNQKEEDNDSQRLLGGMGGIHYRVGNLFGKSTVKV